MFTVYSWKKRVHHSIPLFFMCSTLILSGCGGGGGSSATPAPATPSLSIANASIAEGSTLGVTNLVFTVTLSAASTNSVTMNYSTSDGTALSTSDYTAGNATLTIPAGNITGTITVMINADKTKELNETLTLTLSSPTNASLGTSSATGTILNDDAWGLNDTGVTKWMNTLANNLTVTQPTFPVQDADKGRDVSFPSNSDGKAGFVFTKLDSAGGALANQASVYTTTPWDCVQDSTTGLIWEVKSTSGLRSKSHTYSWYNSTAVNDGGNAGRANGGTCFDNTNCDTEKYVAAVNAAGLCGYTDWRLPKKEELNSIVDYSMTFSITSSYIDAGYFPNIVNGVFSVYWSSSPNAAAATSAYRMDFASGGVGATNKSTNYYVRLVRGGL